MLKNVLVSLVVMAGGLAFKSNPFLTSLSIRFVEVQMALLTLSTTRYATSSSMPFLSLHAKDGCKSILISIMVGTMQSDSFLYYFHYS